MLQRFIKMECKSILLLLLVFTLTGAVLAQDGHDRGRYGEGGPQMPPAAQPSQNLFNAMQAQGVASTITAGQLTADWRVLTVGTLGLLFQNSYGVNDGNDSDDNKLPIVLYYTNGDLLSFGEQKYLVAYNLRESSDPDQRAAQQYYEDQAQGQHRAPQLLKDSVLSLSLLALDKTADFHDIKQFDPTSDIVVTPSKAAFNRNISLANLKQIGLATMLYVQDYDGKFPPMVAARSAYEIWGALPNSPSPAIDNIPVDPKVVQNSLLPYAGNSQIFLQPVTQRPYLPNYKISCKLKSSVKNPAQIFLFYEDAPDADGMRCVAYADGHVETISEAEFQLERIAQGISASGYPPADRPRHKAKATPKPH